MAVDIKAAFRPGMAASAALVLLLALPTAGSALQVIFDNGQTKPMAGTATLPLQTPAIPPPNPDQVVSTFVQGLFPVQTPELSPGPVAAQPVQLALPTPVFLIGDDRPSLLWLDRYRDRLVQLKATGLVVDVASREAFEQLKAKSAPLPLAPVPGSALAKQLGLTHYPVLLTQHLIEQ